MVSFLSGIKSTHVIKLDLTKFVLFIMLFAISCSSPSNEEYAPYLNFHTELFNGKLVSSSFPKGEISFDKDMKYIGSESFILYEVARCEIHLFAELDSLGGYERIYWV